MKEKVVEIGNVNDIFLNPKSEVTKDFIQNIGSNQNKIESKADARGQAENPGTGIIRWSKEGGEYELSFPSDQQGAPVLSTLAKKFDIDFNIRAAGVQQLTDTTVGKMIVDFAGADIEKALEYLKEQGIIVEKVGA